LGLVQQARRAQGAPHAGEASTDDQDTLCHFNSPQVEFHRRPDTSVPALKGSKSGYGVRRAEAFASAGASDLACVPAFPPPIAETFSFVEFQWPDDAGRRAGRLCCDIKIDLDFCPKALALLSFVAAATARILSYRWS